MNTIEIDCLHKSYGTVSILKDINMSIEQGNFVALVGPSGCGKSTLLRTIAGLESITSGSLKIDGAVVNDKAPRERDVAMVFQSYALYPHMTVSNNMGYSLKLKNTAKELIGKAIDGVAHTLGLKQLLERFPRELSGGQRQRVAMGRAIVRRPKVFLFDEPLSNLDAALRVHMRGEIRKLHRSIGATSVYVTHDQIEAMTMADEVVVMRSGRIEQKGTPIELYDSPANKFVGGFIGSPAMNFLEAEIGSDGMHAVLANTENTRLTLSKRHSPGKKVWLGLRPEHLKFSGSHDGLRSQISSIESTGSQTFVSVDVAGVSLVMTQSGRMTLKEQDEVVLKLDEHHVHVFDYETEDAL